MVFLDKDGLSRLWQHISEKFSRTCYHRCGCSNNRTNRRYMRIINKITVDIFGLVVGDIN